MPSLVSRSSFTRQGASASQGRPCVDAACLPRRARTPMSARLHRTPRVTQRSEPIFNVPAVVVGTIMVCVLVHLLRAYGLSDERAGELLAAFAFSPVRYAESMPD